MRKFLSLPLGVALALALACSTARAGFVVTTDLVNTTPGATGFVEVRLTTDASPTLTTLSGYSFQLDLSGASVVFTGVDSSTSDPFVFGPDGTGTLSFDTFPTTSVIVSDVYVTAPPPGFATLAANTTYGLARIAFSVDPSAANGLRPTTFDLGPVTQFTDSLNNPYSNTAIVFTGGGINVQGANVVPVPAGLVLGVIGMGFAGLTRRVWNKKA